MPSIRTLLIPSDKWYTLRRSLEEIKPVAEQSIGSIIDALTRPLTAQEANVPQQKKEDMGPPEYVITGDSYSTALEKFNQLFLENHMGDGLPLVPPTRERLEWMLAGTERPLLPEACQGFLPCPAGRDPRIDGQGTVAGALSRRTRQRIRHL